MNVEILISREPETLDIPAETEAAVRAAAEKVGELYGLENAEVSVTLTDDDHIHNLNRDYRNIDRPTDVLSFALREGDAPAVSGGPEIDMLGDIVISVDRAQAQAQEYGHSLRRETSFMKKSMQSLREKEYLSESN